VTNQSLAISPEVDAAITRKALRWARRAASRRVLVDRARRELHGGSRVEVARSVDRETGEIRRWAKLERVARCGSSFGAMVGLHGPMSVQGEVTRTGHTTGTVRCASVSSCDECGSVIRQKRAERLALAIAEWQSVHGEGSCLFFTETTPHGRDDELGVIVDRILRGHSSLISGSWWAGRVSTSGQTGRFSTLGFRRFWGVEATVRSLEATYGVANGWHPHAHGVMFLRAPLTSAQLDRMRAEYAHRWRAIQLRLGAVDSVTDDGESAMLRHGVDLRAADGDGKVLARYVAGVEKGDIRWSLANEVLRGDLKSAGDSLHPFHLLDGAMGVQGGALWLEWCDAMRGRRVTTWSAGASEVLGVDVLATATDAEVLELDVVAGPLLEEVEPYLWNLALRRQVALSAIEEAGDGSYCGPFRSWLQNKIGPIPAPRWEGIEPFRRESGGDEWFDGLAALNRAFPLGPPI
jgi:hypothetical protein